MTLTLSGPAEPVLLFEARLVGVDGATSSSERDVSGLTTVDLVARFRVSVLDQLGRWMYIGCGLPAEEALATAAFWMLRRPATMH